MAKRGSSARRHTAIDIFAGCGGLSLGLRQAGFSVQAAVEIDRLAAQTYAANHKKTTVLTRDVREVKARDLEIPGSLDLLAGCAPCQGFCSLTSKLKRDDPRNELLLEMARLVEEVQPRAVLMENVPGVLDRGRRIFTRFLQRLRACGYYPQYEVVQMADYGVPQRRRRLILVAGRGFAIPLPIPTHSRTMDHGRLPWRTVRESLGRLPAPRTLPETARSGGPRAHEWHVVRSLQAQTLARLKAAKPGASWLSVAERLRPDCHRGKYVGFTNVYGRMVWDEPSPTITSGCTTPAKGRFGHPDRRRTTISVREAAMLQTFPRDYEFTSEYIDNVCEMVGNAVPPLFAKIVARNVGRAIAAHERALGD